MERQQHNSSLFPYTTLFRSFVYGARLQEEVDHWEHYDGFDSGARTDVEQRNALTDRKSTRLNSSHMSISYAVFCLKKKTQNNMMVSCLMGYFEKGLAFVTSV